METERANENIVSSYFFYMWNKWSKRECCYVYGENTGEHLWNNWVEMSSRDVLGAAAVFYASLSDRHRTWIVERALKFYNGSKEI